MTANNQWISFYEWYYPSANQIEESLIKQFRNEAKQKRLKTDNYVDQKLAEHAIIIPTPLQLPTFSPKIVKMLEKSDVPRHLIAVRNIGEELVKQVWMQFKIHMLKPGASMKHKWELMDGTVHETDT